LPLDAAGAIPTAEGADVFAGAVGEADAGEHFVDTAFQVSAAEAVEVALVAEVFFGGQLLIEAG